MNKTTIGKLTMTLGAAAVLSGLAGTAQARGCISGAAVGGVAGHVAGHHAVLGAAAGCAINHHRDKVNDRKAAAAAQANQPTGQVQPAQSPPPQAPAVSR